MNSQATSASISSPPSIATTIPPELLIKICAWNVPFSLWDIYIPHWDSPTTEYNAEDIRNASQVCRSWRNTLKSAFELWSYIERPKLRLRVDAQKVFTRDWTGSEESDLRVVQSQLLELQFIVDKLDADEPGELPDHMRRYMKSNYLPALQVLSIVCEGNGPVVKLPKRFPSDVTAPALQRLHLHQSYTRHPSQLATLQNTLTHLHLSSTGFEPKVLYDSVFTLHCLQSLALSRAFDIYVNDDDDDGDQERESTTLPCLRELFISDVGYAKKVIRFLGWISAPVLSQFTLDLTFISSRVRYTTPDHRLFHNLADILSTTPSFKQLPVLKIDCHRGIEFQATKEVNIHAPPPPFFKINFSIESFHRTEDALPYQSPMHPAGAGSYWHSLVRELHLKMGELGAYTHVRQLTITTYTDDFPDTVMWQLLEYFPNVVKLEAVNILLWEFLATATTSAEGNESSRTLVLPSLEEISFITPYLILVEEVDGECEDSTDDDDDDDRDDDDIGGIVSLNGDTINEDASDRATESMSLMEESDEEEPTDFEMSDSCDFGFPDKFYIQDLIMFSRQHKNLRSIRFPEFVDEEGILSALRSHLTQLGVSIQARD